MMLPRYPLQWPICIIYSYLQRRKLPPKLLPSNSFKNCSIEQPVRRSSTDEHEKFDENDTYLSNDDEFDNEERNKRLSTIYSRRDSDAPMTENEPKLFAAREKSDKFNRSSLCCDSPSKYEVDLRKNDFSGIKTMSLASAAAPASATPLAL
uniref:Uncharacterized protein n=1 Tax=Romanomermis culicivorax TaxID=13658 RepID=A0A915KW60_ROMCU